MTTPTAPATLTAERADLLETLAAHRYFLRVTVQGLSTEQATRRTTASELTLAGIVKHVAATEASWADFVVRGTAAMEQSPEEWAGQWGLQPGETLESVLAHYDDVAARTDELVRTVDLDSAHPLPEAPWFAPGAVRSARRVFLHVVAETAQHAGHADILRESLDGQKTMG
ncbi:DinB family protein [Geodermatophilus amargosae]|uniref:DinB family protein n=1 Tax=Geodermatophilus amargosae TaxID=1296565 RepID=UPI0034DF4A67